MPLTDPKNQEKMNHIFIEHAPLVRQVIKKLKSVGHIPQHIEEDDLNMAGFYGVMSAFANFDSDVASRLARGDENTFAKYAYTKIRSKILDHVAAEHEVPRTLRNRARRLDKLKQVQPVKQEAQPEVTPKPPKPEGES